MQNQLQDVAIRAGDDLVEHVLGYEVDSRRRIGINGVDDFGQILNGEAGRFGGDSLDGIRHFPVTAADVHDVIESGEKIQLLGLFNNRIALIFAQKSHRSVENGPEFRFAFHVTEKGSSVNFAPSVAFAAFDQIGQFSQHGIVFFGSDEFDVIQDIHRMFFPEILAQLSQAERVDVVAVGIRFGDVFDDPGWSQGP